MAQSLVLHGRTLDVVRAVTRDVAGKLKEDNERMREKADERNLYLLRGGKLKSSVFFFFHNIDFCWFSFLFFLSIPFPVIMPSTISAELLTSADVGRRTSSFNARRALLKSNPSLFISKTRLSVRQIPNTQIRHWEDAQTSGILCCQSFWVGGQNRIWGNLLLRTNLLAS